MHRESWEDMVDCADCGMPVDVERERGYQNSDDWALCWACALERGARFDENADRWETPPDDSGLPTANEHEAR